MFLCRNKKYRRIYTALDKKCLMIIRDDFCGFCYKTGVPPQLNRLSEMVQMRGHNTHFQEK